MATFTLYTAKANPAGPAVEQTPVITGITFNDAVSARTPFQDLGRFLEFLTINAKDGTTWLGSSDGGTTFVRPSDKGAVN